MFVLMFMFFMSGGIMSLSATPNSNQVDIARGLCRIDEIDYPIVGYGTYPLKGKACAEATKQAAAIGYRVIDTATYYKNFDALADLLKEQDRGHFYVISKVWHNMQSPADLRRDLD